MKIVGSPLKEGIVRLEVNKVDCVSVRERDSFLLLYPHLFILGEERGRKEKRKEQSGILSHRFLSH